MLTAVKTRIFAIELKVIGNFALIFTDAAILKLRQIKPKDVYSAGQFAGRKGVLWPSVQACLLMFSAAVTASYAWAETGVCAARSVEGSVYTVCTIDPAKDDLRLFWRDEAGTPYRRFSAVVDAVSRDGSRVAFAMNAGMYSESFVPTGLYIENGHELVATNTNVVAGPPGQVPNFYKQPNGVFFLGKGRAEILATDAYLARSGDRASFATQSGPMLVIGNRLHPALIEGSSDRTWRSGIGVCEGGAVRFAVSEDRVNFFDFARLFRDKLKCADALFLDGGRGVGLYDPAIGRDDKSGHGGYGPMFGLVTRPETE